MASAGVTGSGDRFGALDGWRGIAATAVVLFHIHDHFGPRDHFGELPFVWNAWLFVDFFFVLSGFVIAHAYGRKITDRASCTVFFIHRIGRLWPLNAVVLIAMLPQPLAAAMVGHPTPLYPASQFFSSLVMLQVLTQPILTWNWPSWSISAEFICYGIFGAFALWIKQPSARSVAACAIVAASFVTVFCLSERGLFLVTQLAVVRALLGFFTGYLCYRLWERGALRILRFGTAAEIAAVALVIAVLCISGRDRVSFLATPVFALAVLVFAQERGAISRLLLKRPFAMLGDRSYSIYMLHGPVIIAVNSLALRLSPPGLFGYNRPLQYAVEPLWMLDLLSIAIVALVIALSGLSFRYIENPGRQRFRLLAASFRKERPNL